MKYPIIDENEIPIFFGRAAVCTIMRLWTVIVWSLVFNESVRGQFLNLDSPIRDATNILEEYDFVVVGAGKLFQLVLVR